MATLKSIKNSYNDSGVDTNTQNISLLSFKVATGDSLAKFNLVDGFVDDFQDASGIDAANSTNELRNAEYGYYEGGTAGTVTGGTITTHGVYTVHTFTVGANFTTDVAGTADVLLVGGGGSGAGGHYNGGSGGGGGAGGVRALASQAVSAAAHAVTIGAGGAGSQYGNNGTASSIVLGSTLSAAGGGGGGFGTVDTGDSRNGLAGASGGGGGIGQTAKVGGAGNTPSTSPVQGYAGGDAVASPGNAGGGGGAGEVGSTGLPSAGGDGIQNNWRTGSNIYYGGGGGGSGWNTPSVFPGGQGGGGNSGAAGSNVGSAGTVNTGGGGGGSHGANGSHWPGSAGGTGIVIIRYDTAAGFTNADDLTLTSNAYTAQAEPTTIRIMMDEYTAVGSTTINTDIKAYASRDNGTTYTQITSLASQGTIETNHRYLTGTLDVSGQPTGTAMKYKIETLNQSGSKATRVYGVSMAWA